MKKEYTVAGAYAYRYASPGRWLISHVLRYPLFPLLALAGGVLENLGYSYLQVYMGKAVDLIISPAWTTTALLGISGMMILFALIEGSSGLLRNFSTEYLAQRLERDSRDELYLSLLGKSQTFHCRQRIGDIMARATNDVRALNLMINPGMMLVIDSILTAAVPIVIIGAINSQLLLVPMLFVILFTVTIYDYNRKLKPVSLGLREQFGRMNAGLAESIAGIEIIKGSAREKEALLKFVGDAEQCRHLFVRQGEIQAFYLPMMMFHIIRALALLHALSLWLTRHITLGEAVAFMGLISVLRFTTFISIFSYNLVQIGFAAATRILELIQFESELDENEQGRIAPITGEIVFDAVSFGFHPDNGGSDLSGKMEKTYILQDISFSVKAGETVALVGQTGCGKTTLTRMINRIFDADAGKVMVDGVDVREWNLASLRSQIAEIEQDIFLFSRTIAENIAFGRRDATQAEIESAACVAQAHEFIMSFPEGYQTVIGERGVTLSGGQRQRIAIARAFLTNPRILILDDSASAVDSATEDQIQLALRHIRQRRTTLIITHRMSQIRWADRILVMKNGKLIDHGPHDALIQRCIDYQRLFTQFE